MRGERDSQQNFSMNMTSHSCCQANSGVFQTLESSALYPNISIRIYISITSALSKFCFLLETFHKFLSETTQKGFCLSLNHSKGFAPSWKESEAGSHELKPLLNPKGEALCLTSSFNQALLLTTLCGHFPRCYWRRPQGLLLLTKSTRSFWILVPEARVDI